MEILLEVGLMVVAVQLSESIVVALGSSSMALVPL